uniref:Uncharacterized protein n=1 Tax=Emiliania huxleyi TaxID=2903 RepID=A0A6U8SJK9_EMIHU|mmetsp:Transcript_27386/g.81808  ORF Transcript_27386/g.81808 Transcript_27386/m.81808 type:complete len:213 (-) Transcript_27386:87-725(-)
MISPVSALCAAGFAAALYAHRFWMPPCVLKEPERCRAFGRLSYFTVQTNLINFAYHTLRCLAPKHPLVGRLHPLAFATASMLTVLYYSLDHWNAQKAAGDRKWIAKGYTRLPLGNHVEHGHALPLALLDALCLPRAAASASDVLWINGGYGAAYFAVMVLLGKRLKGEWIYPVLDDLEKGFGPAGPYLLAAAIIAISLLLGLADRSLAAGAA